MVMVRHSMARRVMVRRGSGAHGAEMKGAI
jgi:hypothetical protein